MRNALAFTFNIAFSASSTKCLKQKNCLQNNRLLKMIPLNWRMQHWKIFTKCIFLLFNALVLSLELNVQCCHFLSFSVCRSRKFKFVHTHINVFALNNSALILWCNFKSFNELIFKYVLLRVLLQKWTWFFISRRIFNGKFNVYMLCLCNATYL